MSDDKTLRDDLAAARELGCTLPPPGWRCSREPGHDGPCAARPTADSDLRAVAIEAACEVAGWDWPEVPEEHIPSSQDCMADIVDAVLAVLAGREAAATAAVPQNLAAVADACEAFLRVWRDPRADRQVFGGTINALRRALDGAGDEPPTEPDLSRLVTQHYPDQQGDCVSCHEPVPGYESWRDRPRIPLAEAIAAARPVAAEPAGDEPPTEPDLSRLMTGCTCWFAQGWPYRVRASVGCPVHDPERSR